MKSLNILNTAIAISTLITATPSIAASVSIPNTFTAGQTAVAADVNANFSAVGAEINDNATRLTTLETNTTDLSIGFSAVEATVDNHTDRLTALETIVVTPRFVDNGDGTISDNTTGLMWEKKEALDSVIDLANPQDADNTYTWSSSASSTPDGTVTTDFLDKLNNHVINSGNVAFAGYTDWRLPTLSELRSITESKSTCAAAPCIIDNIFSTTVSNFYWTSTRTNDVNFSMTVNFSDGGEPSFSKGAGLSARAVRRNNSL